MPPKDSPAKRVGKVQAMGEKLKLHPDWPAIEPYLKKHGTKSFIEGAELIGKNEEGTSRGLRDANVTRTGLDHLVSDYNNRAVQLVTKQNILNSALLHK